MWFVCSWLLMNMNYLLVLSFWGNMISLGQTLHDIKGIMYISPTNIHVSEIFQHYFPNTCTGTCVTSLRPFTNIETNGNLPFMYTCIQKFSKIYEWTILHTILSLPYNSLALSTHLDTNGFRMFAISTPSSPL